MYSIEWLFLTIITGFLAFFATNIDDLLLLVTLFSLTDLRKRDIVIGQYLGFFAILGISSLGFFSRWFVPLQLIGFFGLVPIILGIKKMINLWWRPKLTDEILSLQAYRSQSFVSVVFESLLNPRIYVVAAATVGNGGDNIATYIPLFAAGNLIHMVVLIAFFLLLVRLWCSIALTLVSFPAIARVTKKHGAAFLPFIFIILGILIMAKAGTFALLAEWYYLRR